jgi:hypothetical protein
MVKGESLKTLVTSGGSAVLLNGCITSLFSQTDYLPGACLAQKYLNNAKDPWHAWSNALTDRDNDSNNLILRDAEHYLYAYWYVSGNSSTPGRAPIIAVNATYIQILTVGYSLYKNQAWVLGFNVTQPTWDEFYSGLRGVNDAMIGRYTTIQQCAGQQ